MKTPHRGEVYMVDLGLAAKVRPCVVVSVPLEDTDRSLVTVVPHTTSLRQSRFEVTAASPRFLKSGAFDVQGIATVPTVRLMNRLGALSGDQIRALEKAICLWLGINIAA